MSKVQVNIPYDTYNVQSIAEVLKSYVSHGLMVHVGDDALSQRMLLMSFSRNVPVEILVPV